MDGRFNKWAWMKKLGTAREASKGSGPRPSGSQNAEDRDMPSNMFSTQKGEEIEKGKLHERQVTNLHSSHSVIRPQIDK